MNSHKLDYKLYGDDMQFVEIQLASNETVIAEAGSMMMMGENITMETIFGDGSKKGGSKLFNAAKRVLTGESLFMTAFTNSDNKKQQVSFASPYPGKIIPIDLSTINNKLICQKDSFLCATKGISIGIDFRKKLSVGFFGGEGFILQKLEGDGLCFIHAGGTIIKKELLPNQKLRVDTGCLVAMSKDIKYDIEFVGGIKNSLFGGEGLFLASLTGPGYVWIQSLPFSRLASKIFASAPQVCGNNKGEGSILGSFGNLFEK